MVTHLFDLLHAVPGFWYMGSCGFLSSAVLYSFGLLGTQERPQSCSKVYLSCVSPYHGLSHSSETHPSIGPTTPSTSTLKPTSDPKRACGSSSGPCLGMRVVWQGAGCTTSFEFNLRRCLHLSTAGNLNSYTRPLLRAWRWLHEILALRSTQCCSTCVLFIGDVIHKTMCVHKS